MTKRPYDYVPETWQPEAWWAHVYACNPCAEFQEAPPIYRELSQEMRFDPLHPSERTQLNRWPKDYGSLAKIAISATSV